MSQSPKPKRLQVGEFAKTIGKTVRALHLYEELGLLLPVGRSKGGFRLYDQASVERAQWIVKLQGIGFTLAQIQGFVAEFESAESGKAATSKARETFRSRLDELRNQIEKLRSSETDLIDALAYLEGCNQCEAAFTPANCHDCNLNGHEPDAVPGLFAGLSESASNYHVGAGSLKRPRNDATTEATEAPAERRTDDDKQAPVT